MYSRPTIADRGTLVDVTNELDLNLLGVATKFVTMAAASGVMGVLPSTDAGSTLPSSTPGSNTSPAGDVLPNSASGTNPASGTSPVSSGVSPTSASGSAGGSGAPETVGAGQLPFTGYSAMVVAGFGAAMAGAGIAVRSRLGRTPKTPA